jgi:hypothetical protein
MVQKYYGRFCSKCKYVSIVNFELDECPLCDTPLEKVEVDLKGLVKENKIELIEDYDDGDKI